MVARDSEMGLSSRTQIEQKMRDAFGDYPELTRAGIQRALSQQRLNWLAYSANPQNLRFNVPFEKAIVYSPGEALTPPVTRDLTAPELSSYHAFMRMLMRFERGNGTYGNSADRQNKTRFYLSLADGEETIALLSSLTASLEALQQNSRVGEWYLKFDTKDELSGVLRFDQAYRAKGGAPIVYVNDEGANEVLELINELEKKYPNSWVPQKAMLKFNPSGEIAPWHAAMAVGREVGLGIKSTPEVGSAVALAKFIEFLGLNQRWQPFSTYESPTVRSAWERSCNTVWRLPHKPWLTSDRLAPEFFNN